MQVTVEKSSRLCQRREGLTGPACEGYHEPQVVEDLNGYGSIPINTIFRGMNIHLPAILMFTRGTRF